MDFQIFSEKLYLINTATMPCTVRAARLQKMIAQMRARPRLFDLAALFIPEIEVSSPNLGIICGLSHAQIPKNQTVAEIPKDPQN